MGWRVSLVNERICLLPFFPYLYVLQCTREVPLPLVCVADRRGWQPGDGLEIISGGNRLSVTVLYLTSLKHNQDSQRQLTFYHIQVGMEWLAGNLVFNLDKQSKFNFLRFVLFSRYKKSPIGWPQTIPKHFESLIKQSAWGGGWIEIWIFYWDIKFVFIGEKNWVAGGQSIAVRHFLILDWIPCKRTHIHRHLWLGWVDAEFTQTKHLILDT